MISYFLKRRQIDACAKDIVGHIAKFYPPQIDINKNTSSGSKVSKNKAHKKLDRALKSAGKTVSETIQQMNLGAIGRARLCKTIQTELFGLEYTEETTAYLVMQFTAMK